MSGDQARRRGWPLMRDWHAGLWRDWDRLTPRERLEYERIYEETQTAKRLAALRAKGRNGKRANLHAD